MTEDQKMIARLWELYRSSQGSGQARDDFWDQVSQRISTILRLAEVGAKAETN